MNWPGDRDRESIIGATGSGKTQSAVWQLSHRNYHLMPWVIYNFKNDELIDGIPYAQNLELDRIPVKPGIYIVHPHPDDFDAVESQMAAIWGTGHMGVYIDEGYMIGRNNPWFRSILTQGRSKEIPVITLSQRPAWMDRFVFSESQFFQVFRLQDADDMKNVYRYVPKQKVEAKLKQFPDSTLPEFYSLYYDVKQNRLDILKPVPANVNDIYRTFARRLGSLRKAV